DLFRELLQLIVRRGPVHVRRSEARREPLLLEELRKLPRGRRLPLSIQPDQEDPLLLEGDLPGRPQDLDELLVDDADDVLARAHTRRRFVLERPPLELL